MNCFELEAPACRNSRGWRCCKPLFAFLLLPFSSGRLFRLFDFQGVSGNSDCFQETLFRFLQFATYYCVNLGSFQMKVLRRHGLLHMPCNLLWRTVSLDCRPTVSFFFETLILERSGIWRRNVIGTVGVQVLVHSTFVQLLIFFRKGTPIANSDFLSLGTFGGAWFRYIDETSWIFVVGRCCSTKNVQTCMAFGWNGFFFFVIVPGKQDLSVSESQHNFRFMVSYITCDHRWNRLRRCLQASRVVPGMLPILVTIECLVSTWWFKSTSSTRKRFCGISLHSEIDRDTESN